jgi:hypothetical protein
MIGPENFITMSDGPKFIMKIRKSARRLSLYRIFVYHALFRKNIGRFRRSTGYRARSPGQGLSSKTLGDYTLKRQAADIRKSSTFFLGGRDAFRLVHGGLVVATYSAVYKDYKLKAVALSTRRFSVFPGGLEQERL